MRKTAKIICLALIFCMLVNLSGFETLAEDVGNHAEAEEETDRAVDGEKEETDMDQADQDAGSDEGKKDIQQEDGIYREDGAGVIDEVSGTNGSQTGNAEHSETDGKTERKDETIDSQPQEVYTTDILEDIEVEQVSGSNSQLKVLWNPVADASKYQVRVLRYADSAKVSESETTETSLLVAVSQGEKYYIEVKGLKDDGTESASGKIPAVLLAEPSVTAKASTVSVSLTWKSVAAADKYWVTYENKTEDISGTSFEAKGLSKGKKYNFSVQAVCSFTENGKTYTYVSIPAKLAAETAIDRPDKVKTLSGMDGDRSAILTWTKAARAENYVVYRYNDSKKKWETIKTDVRNLTYTDSGLKEGAVYKYSVAAMNKGGRGDMSSVISVSVKKSPGKIRTIGYKAVVKSKAPLFTSKKSKKRVKYLKKGTRVTTIDYGNKRYQIKLSNGKYYWLSKDRLSFRASIWTTKDYSTKAKEDFVNKRGYKSPTKYLIWISQYTQRVIIYKGSKGKWKVIRSGRCSTGTHKYMTPKGKLYITYKEKGWFYKDRYEKPVVRFKSGNAFHSRIKSYKGGYVDATIGRPKSHGCVRLYDEDINFIYKYCPKKTTVISY